MKKIILSGLGAMLLWPSWSSAHETGGGHMMDWTGWGSMMGGGGILFGLTWLIWSIVGVLLIVWLVKQITKDR